MTQQSKKDTKEIKMGLVNPFFITSTIEVFCLPQKRDKKRGGGEGNIELQPHRT